MAETIFSSFETVKYEGPSSEKALAYRGMTRTVSCSASPLKIICVLRLPIGTP